MSRVSGLIIAVLAAAAAAAGVGACEQSPYVQGKAIYEYKCANCHQPDGTGLVGNIPPLAGADWLVEHRDEVMCVIRYGMAGEMEVNGLTYDGVMQGYPELSPTEAVNVANYILDAWGNDLPPLPGSAAQALIDSCGERETIMLSNPQSTR